MTTKTVYIVAGLGFGDEGKGTITEFLADSMQADTVVRYNGGPQAAHHIVLNDGTWHCFSQFSSGSFVSGVKSHLAHSVLIKPSNLLIEREALIKKGLKDIDQKFSLDPESFIVTPWHAMLGRMSELSRGASPHGSVGMGVGIAAIERRNNNPSAIQMLDLISQSKLKDKLNQLWEELNSRARKILDANKNNIELKSLYDFYLTKTAPLVMYDDYCKAAQNLMPNFISDNSFSSVNFDKSLVLEGAQGVLLDFKYGFLPHVTKTDTTFASSRSFLERANLQSADISKVGVLRAYATRHGAGPFVTQDNALNSFYPESHNQTHAWQGAFRVGNFDLVASRYALRVAGQPDYLALTHLDTVGRLDKFFVCNSYLYTGTTKPTELERYFLIEKIAKKIVIKEILYNADFSPAHQERLTQLLFECVPHTLVEFKGWGQVNSKIEANISPNLRFYLDYLESDKALNCPIKILSFGPRASDKYWL